MTAPRPTPLFRLRATWTALLAIPLLSGAYLRRINTAADVNLPATHLHTGTLHGTTVWEADRVHRVTGTVRIPAGSVLRIAAGVRVEGDIGAAIVVDRSARIEALGTFLQPVVFSCAPGAPETRDCWDGLVIAGNAPVNGGAPGSPAVRGTGAAGCAQRVDDTFAGPYGGCDPDDNSGILRYVRVQYGVRGLQLLGVGRGTQVEFVQVHGAAAGGLTLRGGTVDVRHLLVTASGPTGISWRGGWIGRLQHAIVQLPAEGGVAIDGGNDQAAPGLLPRSAPELFNVTAVQVPPTPGLVNTTGIRLALGTAATLRNVLLAGFDVSFDIDGTESCGLIGSSLSLQHGIIATTGAFGDPDLDASCGGGATTEETVLADPSVVRVTDPTLIAGLQKAGFSAQLPDFRTLSPLFVSAAITPPANGFYLPSAYVGAVGIATVEGANIPWHSGWTLGGIVPSSNAFGSIAGTVISPERGPLHGVRVEAGGVSALTGPDGAFTLTGVLAGASAVSVSTAPAGCTLPTAFSVTVAAGATTTTNLSVACNPAVITTSGMILTYICANRFRVRNPNDAVVTVTWDVFGTSETGTLTMPARPLGSGFGESFFETVATGTVRLFYNGSQIQVKANGGAVCTP